MKKIYFSILGIVLILIFGGIIIYNKVSPQIIVEQVLVYGRNLIVNGRVENIDEIDEMKLIIGDKAIDLNHFTRNDYLVFENDNIANIIVLDDFETGDYKIEISVNGKKHKIKNELLETSLEYTSVTKNDKRKDYIIDINKRNIIVNESDKADIYDIVIDPGHSFDESPLVKDELNESVISLEIGLLVKEYLEEAGFKVKMTREDSKSPGGTSDPYGKGSRTGISYEVGAKYLFSIHVNSHYEENKYNGVEVYSLKKVDYKLASSLADNIIDRAKTGYSNKEEYKVSEGVYVRNFSEDEVKLNSNSSSLSGFSAYETLTTNTAYHYIIRETGGRFSGAYVDGRNNNYKANPYRSNYVGAEAYLLELGYITNPTDYKNLLNNYKNYAKGIAEGIIKYLSE